jgi:tetratricopeptide (TPR) repeat protein
MPGDLSGGRRRRTGTALAAAAAGLALAAVLVWQVRAPVPRSLEAGRQAFEAQRYAEAAALFQEALAQRPDLKPRVAQPYAAALRHQAAQVLAADPQQARDLLVRSLEMDAESPEGHFNLGLALLRLEALEPAREAFTRVTALQPAMADAWFNLGYVQDRLGETAGAAASYTRAVELAPPYLDEVLYNLALIEEQRGDLAACLQRLDRAVQFNPQNARAVGYRERIRQRVGADDGRN